MKCIQKNSEVGHNSTKSETNYDKMKVRKKGDDMKKGKWIVLAMIALLVMIPVIKEQLIPEMLRNSRNDDAGALRFEVNEAKAVVFYPKDVEAEFSQNMAQLIKNDLMDTVESVENLKVDFSKSEVGGYLFLSFDAVDEQGNLIKAYKTICDLESHEQVNASDLFQDSFYEFFSSEVRYQMKESGRLGDLAYGKEFYEKTTADAVHDFDLYMDEEAGLFSLNLSLSGQDAVIHVEIEMEQLACYFKEDEVLYQSDDSVVHPVRHYVDAERPMVALTFDDGPVRQNTLLALELLNLYDAKGTFFMLGFRMERNPDVVLSALNGGHEVGSHTYNHPYLTKKGTNLEYQYSRNQEILSEITSKEAEIRLLRPPYGSVDQNVKNTSPYPLVMWSLDTRDWDTLDAKATHNAIMNNVKDGDIILLHDLHESSVESLRTVVPALIEAGYQLVTVSELMEARGIEMKNGVTYSKARK